MDLGQLCIPQCTSPGPVTAPAAARAGCLYFKVQMYREQRNGLKSQVKAGICLVGEQTLLECGSFRSWLKAHCPKCIFGLWKEARESEGNLRRHWRKCKLQTETPPWDLNPETSCWEAKVQTTAPPNCRPCNIVILKIRRKH